SAAWSAMGMPCEHQRLTWEPRKTKVVGPAFKRLQRLQRWCLSVTGHTQYMEAERRLVPLNSGRASAIARTRCRGTSPTNRKGLSVTGQGDFAGMRILFVCEQRPSTAPSRHQRRWSDQWPKWSFYT